MAPLMFGLGPNVVGQDSGVPTRARPEKNSAWGPHMFFPG